MYPLCDFEDKFGKVGIGTHTPTSKLTVGGMIQSLSEEGSSSLTGGADPGGYSSTDVVKSLNGLKGNLTLAQGENIQITQAGSTLTVAAHCADESGAR